MMKKKSRTYYGVYARNGLGVYTDYGKLSDDPYIRGEHIKAFNAREEAEEYAIDGFTLLHGENALIASVPDLNEMWLNFFYFKRSANS